MIWKKIPKCDNDNYEESQFIEDTCLLNWTGIVRYFITYLPLSVILFCFLRLSSSLPIKFNLSIVKQLLYCSFKACKLYSKHWSFREQALAEVYKQMSELDTQTNKEDVKGLLRAATFVFNRAIKDNVVAVSKQIIFFVLN